MTNELIKIFNAYPDKDLYYENSYAERLSQNPNITIEFINDHPNIHWDWSCVSCNPNITIEIMKQYPEKRWDNLEFCSNPNVTEDYVKEYIDDYPYQQYLSANPNCIKIFEIHPEWKWDFREMSSNPNLTLELVEKYPNENWGPMHFHFNRVDEEKMELDLIEKMEVRDYSVLSWNSNITPEFILEHINENWDWAILSGHPSITMEFIEFHKELNWQWDGISFNPNLTLEFIESHKNEEWHWCGISENKFKYDEGLQKVQLNKIVKIRDKIKSFTQSIVGSLIKMIKTPYFWKWYCGDSTTDGGGIGRLVDHRRILDTKWR